MKSLLLFAGIILGIFLPELQTLSFLIPYVLMVMLFISFLGIKITPKVFTKNIFLILFANIALAIVAYFIVLPFNPTFALIAFITAITPTAVSAPVVTNFLKGKVEYVTAAVILTNVVIAALLPLFSSVLHIASTGTSMFAALGKVGMVIFIPLLLAQGIRINFPRMTKQLMKYKMLSFYAWIVVIILAVAKSSYFIRAHNEIPLAEFASIALIVLAICIANFSLGRLLGRGTFGLEASQSLGQKNTTFTLWYAVSFISPLVALGPVFYLVYHNIYNSYQMMQQNRKLAYAKG